MHRKILKISGYSVFSLLLVVLLIGIAVYVRLAQGPISLNFMTDTVQSQINRNLAGLAVSIEGALIERAAETGVPQFRLRNITLRDDKGNTIARAPRAAIGVNESKLLTGRVVPTSIELIGPRIFIKRNLEGGMELGFGSPAAPEGESISVEETPEGQAVAEGKSDQQQPAILESSSDVSGRSIIDTLAGGETASQTTIGSVEDIRVSGASIKLFDEANDAIWNIPMAELAFRRMPYGFAFVANAKVANGNEGGSWHAEVSASYRRESRSFSISTRISDLVPANISDEIFALSQLARVKVPLSGQAEIEMSDTGKITRATAEFAAAAGAVAFPDYLAETLNIDEGSLRADYEPKGGGIHITESTLLVEGSMAELTGLILPLRDEEGRLTALKFDLKTRNRPLGEQDAPGSLQQVDRIDLSGTASIDDARFDIADLLVMSGNSGLRMRGSIMGGGESAGLSLSGRIRDLPSTLLRRLWPPVMAPKTREWINRNIKGGRITDGEFVVNLPVDALAKAQRDRRLPDNSINLTIAMAGVSTSYFKNLPPLQNASGQAQLKDNDFNLIVDGADLTLPSGGKVKLEQGGMDATDILAAETLATFKFQARSAAQGMLEYLDLPDLRLISTSGVDSSKLDGDARLAVTLELPLIKNVPRERVIVTAKAHLGNASIRGALRKLDVTDGEFDLVLAKGQLSGVGKAKLNGVDVDIAWQRSAGASGKQSATIEASLDDAKRKKIGADISDFLSGTVSVKATIEDLHKLDGAVKVEADLSKADMQIGAINWSRAATEKTGASFVFQGGNGEGMNVDDIHIEGPGVLIEGDVSLDPAGKLREVKLSRVELSDENRYSLTINKDENRTVLAMSGDSFDARPLIKSMFKSKSSEGEPDKRTGELTITANVDRVYAHRGEIVTGVNANVRSQNGRVQAAEISGTFISGQPVVMRIAPVEGGKELRISGRDGGAALRAANLYSKIAGGQIDFTALMGNDTNSTIKRGSLIIRDFDVRDEAALAQLDAKGKPRKTGPRKDGTAFKRLILPFTTDEKFVRVCDSLIRGDELGATAEGLIRKSDGAIDITGTIIPAYGVNAVWGKIPILGDILTGGGGEGIFGLTYALGGGVDKPKFEVNPVSAVAPGILRKFFEYDAGGRCGTFTTSKNTDKSG